MPGAAPRVATSLWVASGRWGGRGRVQNGRMGFPSGTVTLLFTDVEGSIRLWEADREAMAEASAGYSRIVREQVEVAGGQVVTSVGEAFVRRSLTRPPRWPQQWLSSGLSVRSRGRPVRRSGCGWRCMREPVSSVTAITPVRW